MSVSIADRLTTIASKGLYPRENNLIIVGITDHGSRQTFQYGQLPSDLSEHNAIFEMGSVTKVFTSILLAELVQQGILSLDDPITKYFPDYAKAVSNNMETATLRHLASHTSGLPREDKVLNKRVGFNKQKHLNPYAYYAQDDLHSFLQTYEQKQRQMNKWRYSNLGMALLARIIEQVTQMSYEQALKTLVSDPLGLQDTVVQLHDEQRSRLIKAYTHNNTPIPPLTTGGILGAGGIYSSMQDMLRFLELNIEPSNQSGLSSLEFAQSKQAGGPNKHFDMGLGWFIEYSKKLQQTIIWTGGTTIGFHTYAGFIKEHKLGVVVLSTYHLKLSQLAAVLLGGGPIVTSRLAQAVFLSKMTATQ